MTPDQLRAAAERLKEFIAQHYEYFGDNVRAGHQVQIVADIAAVLNCVLADHHADDGVEIDEAWLRSVGFAENDMHNLTLPHDEGQWIAIQAVNSFWDAIEIWVPPNSGALLVYRESGLERGDIRRLCAALGIELKEQAK